MREALFDGSFWRFDCACNKRISALYNRGSRRKFKVCNRAIGRIVARPTGRGKRIKTRFGKVQNRARIPPFVSSFRNSESWQNGYCTGLENRRPKGHGGSNPSLSVSFPSTVFAGSSTKSRHAGLVYIFSPQSGLGRCDSDAQFRPGASRGIRGRRNTRTRRCDKRRRDRSVDRKRGRRRAF